jgi:hypothetical protein
VATGSAWMGEENLIQTGFDFQTIQPVASCHTDYAILAHLPRVRRNRLTQLPTCFSLNYMLSYTNYKLSYTNCMLSYTNYVIIHQLYVIIHQLCYHTPIICYHTPILNKRRGMSYSNTLYQVNRQRIITDVNREKRENVLEHKGHYDTKVEKLVTCNYTHPMPWCRFQPPQF